MTNPKIDLKILKQEVSENPNPCPWCGGEWRVCEFNQYLLRGEYTSLQCRDCTRHVFFLYEDQPLGVFVKSMYDKAAMDVRNMIMTVIDCS